MNKGVVSGCCLDVDRLLALARTTGPTGPYKWTVFIYAKKQVKSPSTRFISLN